MKSVAVVLALALMIPLAGVARAQEPELVSEIVVRVNNDIITRHDYMAALKDFKAALAREMQQQGKGEAEINAEFEKLRPTVLDMMIDDLLLEQKAKELSIDVEAEVNQEMAVIAKENGFKDQLSFERALRDQGIEPDAARASIRKRLQQQFVVQREVIQPIFQSVGDKDRREFYDKHKDGFTSQGEVTISEIFVPLEGYTATDIEQRAHRIVAELRAGQDFAQAVQRYSPASRASRAQGGKVGTFRPDELKGDIAAAIQDLKPGDVTEPIRLQDGYQIIRVDDRKPPVLHAYDDPKVQEALNRAITMERAEGARKKYLTKLREDAYIKITPGYSSAWAEAQAAKKS